MSATNTAEQMKLQGLASEEEFRLIQRLFLLRAGGAPRVVVFTGIDSGGGCSWVVERAARNLAAHASAKVCLIDGNLQLPTLHRAFGADNRKGLAQLVLQGGQTEELLHRVANTNLWFLPAGPPISERYRVLASERVKALIGDLRAKFDYVLIDSPAARPYADALLLAGAADGLVVVIESGGTKQEAAISVKQSIDNAGLKILGAVLNRRTYPIPERIYRRL